MADITVRKFLDCSTIHLDAESRDFLTAQASLNAEADTSPLPMADHHVARHAYGWWCYAPSEKDYYTNLPKVLQSIITLAREHNCEYINFDSDAADCSKLKTFPEVWT